MQVEELKAIITSQHQALEELFKKEIIINRDIDSQHVKTFLSKPNILAIFGIILYN